MTTSQENKYKSLLRCNLNLLFLKFNKNLLIWIRYWVTEVCSTRPLLIVSEERMTSYFTTALTWIEYEARHKLTTTEFNYASRGKISGNRTLWFFMSVERWIESEKVNPSSRRFQKSSCLKLQWPHTHTSGNVLHLSAGCIASPQKRQSCHKLTLRIPNYSPMSPFLSDASDASTAPAILLCCCWHSKQILCSLGARKLLLPWLQACRWAKCPRI